MNLNIETFTNGTWRQNCYIVANSDLEAIIIDPGSDPDYIADSIGAKNWKPIAIINTHAHYDHVGAVAPLMKRYGIPFYLHGDDAQLLRKANTYSLLFGSKKAIDIPEIDHDISEIATPLIVGGFSIDWCPTPGHTHGSICLTFQRSLFTGDTLFADAIGRTDLPGGDAKQLTASISKLEDLDENLTIYAGHGKPARLGDALLAAQNLIEALT